MGTQTRTKSQLNVKIDESVHEELKILSIRTKKNLNRIVEEAIIQRLSKEGAVLSGKTQIDKSLYERYIEKKEEGKKS